MKDDATKEKETETTRSKTSGKKRLSKKERKALKKKQKKNHHGADAVREDGDGQGAIENGDQVTNRKEPTPKIEIEADASSEPSKQQNKKEKKSTEDDDEEDTFFKSYKPIPVPDRPSADIVNSSKSSKQQQSKNNDDIDEGGGGSNNKTLGKWFPNALLIKCQVNYTNTGKLLLNDDSIKPESVKVENPRASLVLFYQYTPSARKWSPTKIQLLMTYLQTIARHHRQISGRIRVAQEGVNATISSIDIPGCTAKETLRHFGQDLKKFDPVVFANTDFKYIDDLPADRHFKELKVIPVQELVFYDIAADEAPLEDNKNKPTTTSTNDGGGGGGIHLDAKEYHEMLKKKNAVVIDVRNHYETIIGRFDGQQEASNAADHKKKNKKKNDAKEPAAVTAGAEYLDPLMRKSTDFKSWLAKEDTKEKLKDKTVLMYCTGGIRCERASAYLKKEMGQDVEEVYQLQGGIERYLKAFPDGGFWRGKNFVFDKREAVGVDNPEGDGGVIRKQKKKKKQAGDVKEQLPSKCCVCDVPWDRYVGKKKCFTCGVPVLMCDKCMSLKPDKTPGMQLKVRCPLCVTENITKPASEVDWTANGMKSKIEGTNDKAATVAEEKKAAQSVLKWGGGHASNKKLGRKVKGRMCRFGAECIRKDCFFEHPEGRQAAGKGKR